MCQPYIERATALSDYRYEVTIIFMFIHSTRRKQNVIFLRSLMTHIYSSITTFAIYTSTEKCGIFFLLKFKATQLKLSSYFTVLEHFLSIPSLSIIVTDTDGVRRVARILLLLKPILMVSFPSGVSSSMI